MTKMAKTLENRTNDISFNRQLRRRLNLGLLNTALTGVFVGFAPLMYMDGNFGVATMDLGIAAFNAFTAYANLEPVYQYLQRR